MRPCGWSERHEHVSGVVERQERHSEGRGRMCSVGVPEVLFARGSSRFHVSVPLCTIIDFSSPATLLAHLLSPRASSCSSQRASVAGPSRR